MAKKCLLVLVLAAVVEGGVFAQAEFRLGVGGFAFFDMTYAELSLGFLSA
jgi:hypothetical protein